MSCTNLVTGGPGSTGTPTGPTVCAVKDNYNSLWAFGYSAGSVQPTNWTYLGRINSSAQNLAPNPTGPIPIEGSPSCTSAYFTSAQAVCGVRGTDNAFYAIAFTLAGSPTSISPAWQSGWIALGGVYTSDPSCASDGSGGDVFCAGAGQDSQLYYTEFTVPLGQYPPTITGLGGLDVEGTPSCVSNVNAYDYHGVICAVRGGGNSNLYAIAIDPGYQYKMHGWQNVGGWVEGNPSCAIANDSTGQVICGVRGAESALWAVEFDPFLVYSGTPPVWRGLAPPWPVYFDGSPSCTYAPATSSGVICSIRGTDNNLYAFAVDPSYGSASSVQEVNTSIQGDPACASPGNGAQAVCALKMINGQVNFVLP
jgi:hypothetical protein